MHLAAKRGDGKVVRFLLENGAAVVVNAINGQNHTALSLAAAAKKLSLCEVLIRYGADPKTGNNALVGAVAVLSRKLTELLLKAGA
ncbi:ankyrin repeat domain-containing protein, partial [Streptococcus suis]|uniref:ankyrin repeat domain-containing protein n=1 Tax=Streptococcus suis TaxID=1307 RepID=UPI00370B0E33